MKKNNGNENVTKGKNSKPVTKEEAMERISQMIEKSKNKTAKPAPATKPAPEVKTAKETPVKKAEKHGKKSKRGMKQMAKKPEKKTVKQGPRIRKPASERWGIGHQEVFGYLYAERNDGKVYGVSYADAMSKDAMKKLGFIKLYTLKDGISPREINEKGISKFGLRRVKNDIAPRVHNFFTESKTA